MNGIWHDLRFGLRMLAAHPRFTAVAVGVLALGIAATTTVFSIVNAVLLRPLPYDEPDRLVAVTSVFKSSTVARPSPVVALTDVAEWRKAARSFESLGAFAYTQLPVRVGTESFAPVTALMDPEFLPTLGRPLALGSLFDRGAASDASAIVSHAFWVRALGSDPAVIGRTITVDGEAFVVRGVLRVDFQFPRSDASYSTKPVDLLLPASSYPGFPAGSRQWFAIARLAPGVTLTQAREDLQRIAEAISTASSTGDRWSVELTPLHDETTRRARGPVMIVLGISALLLLIAATNLMNLFFSRGVARLREMSVRRALGSSTARLVRQLLIESLVVATVGGIAGVWLTLFAVRAITALSPVHLPVTRQISVDATVLLFTLGVCVAAALAASFFPALHVSTKADEAVRSPGMRTSASRGVARVQQALCVAQIALGMGLLTSAGLLSLSLWHLSTVAPGFDPAQVIGFNLSVPNDQSREARVEFYARALEEIRTIPGVSGAGLISFLPPETRAGVLMGVAIDGIAPPPGETLRINTLITSPGYFDTMRTRIVRGRDFTDADNAQGQPVILVNEAFARQFLGDRDPLGLKIGTGFDGLKPVRAIVGVVQDTHDRGLARAAIPTVYISFAQFALPYGAIAVRAQAPLESIVPVIRDRLNRLNPSVPLSDFQMLETRLFESLREPRFYTVLAATCASMAVLFVTFGLYGLVSYSVARRTAEIGIRMAVGAQRGTILRLVLLQGVRLSALGIVFGLGLAAAGTGLLRSLLFQVEPVDPLTLVAAAVLVILVTLVASYAPARRASRLDPLVALRHE